MMTYDTLYLCEKPSQARALAKQLGAGRIENNVYVGGGNVVLNAYGHLLNLATPEDYGHLGPWNLDTLPILPQKWVWKIKSEHVEQYDRIACWLDRARTVVIATDPDEEGEVIGRQILYELGFKGNIRRLWVSALDPNSLKQALGNLLPLSATDRVYRAGCVRRQLDWLYGINLSRALSVSSGQPTSVGRVTTKLLTELVKREMEIRRFTPRPHYTATASFGDAVLEWQPADGLSDIPYLPPNGEITGICIAASEYQETMEAPAPLTLSALLADAAESGIDVASGYAAAQKLYELGLISYPRTSSTVIPGAGMHGFAPHHAIINIRHACPDWVPNDCQEIFETVHRNCMQQIFPEAIIHVRKLKFDMGGEIFTATDRWLDANKPGEEGWMFCQPKLRQAMESNFKTKKFRPGDQVRATLSVVRKQTAPPRRFTEAELMRHMAKLDIGTEATRVDAIKKLIRTDVAMHMQAEPGHSLELSPTEKGMNLFELLPSSVKGATMDTQMRNALDHVRSGQADSDVHLSNAARWLAITIERMKIGDVHSSTD